MNYSNSKTCKQNSVARAKMLSLIFLVALELSNLVGQSSALKLGGASASSQKHRIDLVTEARSIAISLSDAQSYVATEEVKAGVEGPADFKAMLQSRIIRKLQSSVDRWTIVEAKLRNSISGSSYNQVKLFDETIINVAGGKSLLGHLYWQTGVDNFALAERELEEACPLLWEYNAAKISADTHSWLDCYIPLREIYLFKSTLQKSIESAQSIEHSELNYGIKKLQILDADFQMRFPWIATILREKLENPFRLRPKTYLSELAQLSRDERRIIVAETKLAWSVADESRLIVSEFIHQLVTIILTQNAKRASSRASATTSSDDRAGLLYAKETAVAIRQRLSQALDEQLAKYKLADLPTTLFLPSALTPMSPRFFYPSAAVSSSSKSAGAENVTSDDDFEIFLELLLEFSSITGRNTDSMVSNLIVTFYHESNFLLSSPSIGASSQTTPRKTSTEPFYVPKLRPRALRQALLVELYKEGHMYIAAMDEVINLSFPSEDPQTGAVVENISEFKLSRDRVSKSLLVHETTKDLFPSDFNFATTIPPNGTFAAVGFQTLDEVLKVYEYFLVKATSVVSGESHRMNGNNADPSGATSGYRENDDDYLQRNRANRRNKDASSTGRQKRSTSKVGSDNARGEGAPSSTGTKSGNSRGHRHGKAKNTSNTKGGNDDVGKAEGVLSKIQKISIFLLNVAWNCILLLFGCSSVGYFLRTQANRLQNRPTRSDDPIPSSMPSNISSSESSKKLGKQQLTRRAPYNKFSINSEVEKQIKSPVSESSSLTITMQDVQFYQMMCKKIQSFLKESISNSVYFFSFAGELCFTTISMVYELAVMGLQYSSLISNSDKPLPHPLGPVSSTSPRSNLTASSSHSSSLSSTMSTPSVDQEWLNSSFISRGSSKKSPKSKVMSPRKSDTAKAKPAYKTKNAVAETQSMTILVEEGSNGEYDGVDAEINVDNDVDNEIDNEADNERIPESSVEEETPKNDVCDDTLDYWDEKFQSGACEGPSDDSEWIQVAASNSSSGKQRLKQDGGKDVRSRFLQTSGFSSTKPTESTSQTTSNKAFKVAPSSRLSETGSVVSPRVSKSVTGTTQHAGSRKNEPQVLSTSAQESCLTTTTGGAPVVQSQSHCPVKSWAATVAPQDSKIGKFQKASADMSISSQATSMDDGDHSSLEGMEDSDHLVPLTHGKQLGQTGKFPNVQPKSTDARNKLQNLEAKKLNKKKMFLSQPTSDINHSSSKLGGKILPTRFSSEISSVDQATVSVVRDRDVDVLTSSESSPLNEAMMSPDHSQGFYYWPAPEQIHGEMMAMQMQMYMNMEMGRMSVASSVPNPMGMSMPPMKIHGLPLPQANAPEFANYSLHMNTNDITMLADPIPEEYLYYPYVNYPYPFGPGPIPHHMMPLPVPMSHPHFQQANLSMPMYPITATSISNSQNDGDLRAALRTQIEYYFSEENLVRDKYLREKMDDSGYVMLREIAKFKRVAIMDASPLQIVEAIHLSEYLEIKCAECLDVSSQVDMAVIDLDKMKHLSSEQILDTKIRSKSNPHQWVATYP